MSKVVTTQNNRLPEIMTRTNNAKILTDLQSLFDKVMSGDDYNKDQVKSATKLADSAVKVMRMEFDVYKFLTGRVSS